ncbi:hypothetical protein BH11PLA2_BH11PLA2_49580 [soil metagenome]
MRYLALNLLLLISLPAYADKPPADATGTATDVVKAAIKATGGAELIDKLKCSTMKMEGEVTVMGLNLDFTGDMAYSPPDKFKMSMKMSVMGMKLNVEQVMNGKKLKSTLNGQAIPIDEDAIAQMKDNMNEHEMSQLTPLLDEKKYKLKLGDEAEIDGSKAALIVVSGESLKDQEVKLYFDKKTNLLVKMQRKSKEQGVGEVDEESFFTEYKKVQDVMTPMKFVVKHDGKAFMTIKMTEVKLSEKIDDKEFATDD